MKITLTIQNDIPNRRWAYAVNIDDKLFAIGYGNDYSDTQKIASRKVRQAEKWVQEALVSERNIKALRNSAHIAFMLGADTVSDDLLEQADRLEKDGT